MRAHLGAGTSRGSRHRSQPARREYAAEFARDRIGTFLAATRER